MLFTMENTIYDDPPMRLVRLVDANGLECDPRVIEVDTQTGRVLYFKRDDNDRVVIDRENFVAVREEVHFPAPLIAVYEPCEPLKEAPSPKEDVRTNCEH